MKYLFVIVLVAAFTFPIFNKSLADRLYPGANCHSEILGPASPTLFLNRFNRGDISLEFGSATVICPITFEETREIVVFAVSVVGEKSQEGTFACSLSVAFDLGRSFKRSLLRSICAERTGCDGGSTGDAYTSFGTIFLAAPFDFIDRTQRFTPDFAYIKCEMNAGSTLRSYRVTTTTIR